MNPTQYKILLIEDNEGHARLILRSFQEHGKDIDILHVQTLANARQQLSQTSFDLIISDMILPDGNGQEILGETTLPMVMMTSHGNETHAVEIIKSGALDYIPKTESTLLSMAHIARRALQESRHLLERKSVEEKLVQNEKKFRSLFETAPDLMLSLDPQGVITNCNNRAREIIGYEPAELIGRPLTGFVVEEYRQAIAAIIDTLQANTPVFHNEYEICKKDGAAIFVSASYSAIANDGSALSTIITNIEDITAHKQALRALAQAKEQAEKATLEKERVNKQLEESMMQANWMAIQADAANKAKSQFLANMSHEIRTPLNAILGFIDILSNEELTASQKEYIQTIKSSAENLTTIINDILDLSKIEAGKLNIEKIPVKLDDILYSIENIMKHAAEKKGLDYKVTRSTPLPDVIKTDPTRLKQCLINLINNAIKFTHQGQVLVLVSHEKYSTGPVLHFSVKDTGIGISIEQQKTIFEAFSQADGSTTRKYGGTGLGLSITKRLSAILGGNVTVTSTLGKGSAFTLTIPVEKDKNLPDLQMIPADPDQPALPAGEEKLSGAVLVAEDNLSNQMLMKVLLRKMGLDCVIVNDGQEAVNELRHKHFDLVLMDIQMPILNGLDAARKIRESGNQVPIIALTAHAFETHSQNSIEAGCNDHLAKPIDFVTLRTMMARYLHLSKPDGAGFKSSEVQNLTIVPNTTRRTEDFLKTLPQQIENIRNAFSKNNLRQINTLSRVLNISSNEAGLEDYADLFLKLQQLTVEENNGEIERVIEHLNKMRHELAYHLEKRSGNQP